MATLEETVLMAVKLCVLTRHYVSLFVVHDREGVLDSEVDQESGFRDLHSYVPVPCSTDLAGRPGNGHVVAPCRHAAPCAGAGAVSAVSGYQHGRGRRVMKTCMHAWH